MFKESKSSKMKSEKKLNLGEHKLFNIQSNIEWEEKWIKKQEIKIQQEQLRLEKKKSQLEEEKEKLKKKNLQLQNEFSQLQMRKAILEVEQASIEKEQLVLQKRAMHIKALHAQIKENFANERLRLQVMKFEYSHTDSKLDFPRSNKTQKFSVPNVDNKLLKIHKNSTSQVSPKKMKSSYEVLKIQKPFGIQKIINSNFSSDSQAQEMKSLADLKKCLEVFQKFDQKNEGQVDYLRFRSMISVITKEFTEEKIWQWIKNQKNGNAIKFTLKDLQKICQHLLI